MYLAKIVIYQIFHDVANSRAVWHFQITTKSASGSLRGVRALAQCIPTATVDQPALVPNSLGPPEFPSAVEQNREQSLSVIRRNP